MKKTVKLISVAVLLILSILILAGCSEIKTGNRIMSGKDVQTFTYAYIQLGPDRIKEGYVTQWRDYEKRDIGGKNMENEYEVITETYYRCPKCHKAYKVLQEAKECLSSHAYPEEIVDYTYSGYGVPTEITVKLSNGNAAIYRLHLFQKGGT